MIDRLFTAALAFGLLAGGTLAIGSALFESRPAPPALPAAPQVLHLPAVEVTAKRVETGTAWAGTEGSEPVSRKLQ